MKTWNIPSLEELDVKMTAGGDLKTEEENDVGELFWFMTGKTSHNCCYNGHDWFANGCSCPEGCEWHIANPNNGGNGEMAS